MQRQMFLHFFIVFCETSLSLKTGKIIMAEVMADHHPIKEKKAAGSI